MSDYIRYKILYEITYNPKTSTAAPLKFESG